MKRIFISAMVISFFVACGGGGSKDEKKEDKKETSNDITENPDYQKGVAIVAKNDCLTCHRVDEMLTGPSFRDVANKYAGSDTAVAYLASKIISGGNGVWGNTPMVPHPGISKEDAESLAKYILLLKNK
jgi:cytochrome c